MSLPDTAEYWNDIKESFNRVKPIFAHIPDADCGHYHVRNAKRLGDVSCHACLRMIDKGYDHKLKPGVTLSRGQKKQIREIKKQEKMYGRCSCGALRISRTRHKDGKKFLGCSKYPECKITSNI